MTDSSHGLEDEVATQMLQVVNNKFQGTYFDNILFCFICCAPNKVRISCMQKMLKIEREAVVFKRQLKVKKKNTRKKKLKLVKNLYYKMERKQGCNNWLNVF